MEAIEQRIKEQGDRVRSLKSSKAEKDVITAEVARLNELKAELKALAPKDDTVASKASSPAKSEDKKAKGGFTLKNAKVIYLPGIFFWSITFPPYFCCCISR